MNLDYFKYCKEILFELQKAIDEDNKYNIYKSIPSLLPIVAITYYCLTEDIIITKDDKSSNIEEKFTLNLPESVIDTLFIYENDFVITKKMTDNKLWLLSAIRNSIMHGSAEIDITNKKVIINNPSFKNQLQCEISFNWFLKYLFVSNIKNNYISNEVSFIYTNIIDNVGEAKNFKELDSEYIYKNILHFHKIDIKPKDKNKNQIPRDTFIRYIVEYSYEYVETFNASLQINDQYSLINCLKRGVPQKENETEDEYNNRLFKYYYKKHLINNFQEKFPDYEISVTAVRPKTEFRELLEPDNIEYILNIDNCETQKRYASSWINNELLKKLITPFPNEEFFTEFINAFMKIDDLTLDGYIKLEDINLLMSKNLNDRSIAYSNILNMIKRYNILSKKTYNEIITKKIIMMDFKGPDFLIASKLSTEIRYKFDIGECYYYNPEVVEYAKTKCPYLFEKYSIILEGEKSLSDQDDQVLRNLPIDEIESLGNVINNNKDSLIKMIIYLSGINCFVLNKESLYDEETEIYDGLLDDSFEAFSKTIYEHEHRILRQRKEKAEAKILKLKSIRFNPDKTPQHVIDKTNNEITDLEIEIEEVNEELEKYIVREIEDINMVKVEKDKCATLIRNSLSHPDRIKITSDLKVILKDYDSKGELDGVVYVSFNDLLNFFLNDAFDRKLNNPNI